MNGVFEAKRRLGWSDPVVGSILNTGLSSSPSRLFELTTCIYHEFAVPETIGVYLADHAAQEKCWRSMAIYLEAYGSRGYRSGVICQSLSESPGLPEAIEFLRLRPEEMRNTAVVRWLEGRLPQARSGRNEVLKKRHSLVVVHDKKVPHLGSLIEQAGDSQIKVIFPTAAIAKSQAKSFKGGAAEHISMVGPSKVDVESDTEIFTETDLIAARLTEATLLRLRGGSQVEHVKSSIQTVVRSHINQGVRFQRFLKSNVRQKHHLICIGESSAKALATAILFRTKVTHVGPGGEVSVLSCQQRESLVSLLLEMSIHFHSTDFDFPKLAIDGNGLIVHCLHAEPLAMGNLESLMGDLAASFPIVLELGNLPAGNLPAGVDHVLETTNRIGNVQVVREITRAQISHRVATPIVRAIQAAMMDLVQSEEPEVIFALTHAYAQIVSSIHQVCLFAEQWTDVVRQAGGVLLLSGRTTKGLTLAALAKAHEIPSFELQNGTVSSNNRYPPSATDQLLLNDPFSLSVYRDNVGMAEKTLSLVGSPRLDTTTKQARNTSIGRARQICYGLGVPREAKVIIFASQPLELQTSLSLLDTIGVAMRELPDSYYLSIRMHPREGEEVAIAYRKLLKEHNIPSARLLPSVHSGLDLAAADVVITYYSTLGVEAQMLGKRVICVAPNELSYPPFDLCSMGAKGPVWEGPVLASLILSEWTVDQKLIPSSASAEIVTQIQSKFLM